MRPAELEDIAARHVPGAGQSDIHHLSSGLANETYRVVRDGNRFALRVAGPNPYRLGFDRVWEARVLEHAAAADLAPALEYCDPERGILIARWVDGRSWDAAGARRRSSISKIAELARRIHAMPMPSPPRLMSPANWIDYYSNAAAPSEVAAALRTACARRLAALAALPSAEPVVCHSDMHPLNLVDRGSSVILLDWEYVHATDPFWDLAGWSANNDFEDELTHELLASYIRRPPTHQEHRRLELLEWLYDYVCLLWCDLYSSLHAAAAQDGVAARARLLAARLHTTSSGRAD